MMLASGIWAAVEALVRGGEDRQRHRAEPEPPHDQRGGEHPLARAGAGQRERQRAGGGQRQPGGDHPARADPVGQRAGHAAAEQDADALRGEQQPGPSGSCPRTSWK